MPSGHPRCASHPRRFAEFVCKQCRLLRCEPCTHARAFGAVTLRFCTCHGECEPIGRFLEATVDRSPGAVLFDALHAASRRDALLTIGVGAACLSLVLAVGAPGGFWFFRVIMLVVTALLFGYAYQFVVDAIAAAYQGERGPTEWPDVLDLWSACGKPLLIAVTYALVSGAPAIAATLLGAHSVVIALLAAFATMLFFALTAGHAVTGELLRPLPFAVAWLFRSPATFALAGATALAAHAALAYLPSWFAEVPLLGRPLAFSLALFAALVAARTYGALLAGDHPAPAR
jgi:hypothetical protein